MDAASDVPMQLFPRNILLASLFVVAGVPFPTLAEDHPFITVATTSSALKSGLLDFLVPIFTHSTGIEVYVAAEGTRHALESGELGECDVVLVHDRSQELQFMQNGFGSLRREVMYNDYILVGPEDDPAKIKGMHDASAALRKIADAKALFISRGDMSTTDVAERQLWTEAVGRQAPDRDSWHLETGSSMQQTVTTAASMNGYAFADRATWVKFGNRRHLGIVVDGDPRMIDQYAAVLVNPARHPQVKSELGIAFIEWLTSREGQDTIASYKIDDEQVFFPNYKP
jgi:tungstate transport system substrate-binding protein